MITHRQRGYRIASVTRPAFDDRCRGVLAHESALIGLGQPMVRQEEKILCVNVCRLRRESIHQNVARRRGSSGQP
jgi:hypothetical protein